MFSSKKSDFFCYLKIWKHVSPLLEISHTEGGTKKMSNSNHILKVNISEKMQQFNVVLTYFIIIVQWKHKDKYRRIVSQ
jgi:hypothetical protein